MSWDSNLYDIESYDVMVDLEHHERNVELLDYFDERKILGKEAPGTFHT